MFAQSLGVIRVGLAALCAGLLLVPAVHAQKWSRVAPFPDPSEEIWGASAGGKLYVFGGIAPGWKPKSYVYEYDPANDSWKALAPMPTRRGSPVAGAFIGNRLHLVSGDAQSASSGTHTHVEYHDVLELP
jgi:N-acetylneuraminic acid mutarotase